MNESDESGVMQELTKLREDIASLKLEILKNSQDLKAELNKLGENFKPATSRNIDGWTVRKTAKGYYSLNKSFRGKVHTIYIGKELDETEAKKKIAGKISELRKKGII
ncbi:MAG: hypothetical protein GY749_23720 [Desulfobacteraceae bacterium]|nr:hypothetical protein [Desulfobacteraceae bacterium]